MRGPRAHLTAAGLSAHLAWRPVHHVPGAGHVPAGHGRRPRHVRRPVGRGSASTASPTWCSWRPGCWRRRRCRRRQGSRCIPSCPPSTWNRTFQSMISTPICRVHVVIGQSLWMVVRLAIVTHRVRDRDGHLRRDGHPRGIAGSRSAILTGLAFALPIMAFTVDATGDSSFPPSTASSSRPCSCSAACSSRSTSCRRSCSPSRYATPLWNGVSLARGIAIGTIDAPLARGHLASSSPGARSGLFARS